MMKRFLPCLAVVLLVLACSPAPAPVIKDYRIAQAGGFGIGADGIVADMALDLDIDNPASARYTLEALEATLYKGIETTPYALLSMKDTVFIEPRCEQTLTLPLAVRILRPLSLRSGGFDTDLSKYEADINLTVRKGSFKKTIREERVPLDRIAGLLGSPEKKN